MKTIESHDAISSSINLYPNTRSSAEAQKFITAKGIGYGDYIVGEPLKIEDKMYGLLTAQVRSYLNICERITDVYLKDPIFRRYVRALVLQFEDPSIKELVENYPIATISGVRFGTDTIITEDGDLKTTEVNLGPVGGPPEAIKAQRLSEDTALPISSNLLVDHFIHSVNAYYSKACEAIGIEPKPFDQRYVVYVENDGWFPGSYSIVNDLRVAGMNITIAPKEALKYDEMRNTLNLVDGSKTQPVDQVILYFHLQEDLSQSTHEQADREYGHIIKALQNHAVVAETSTLPLIVLASKSIAGLISQMANDPEGLLARRLNIDSKDIDQVKDMFPTTFHWRSRYFDRQEEHTINRFNLPDFFSLQGFIVKNTRTDLYGGHGVFGSDKPGKNSYEALSEDLKKEVINSLTTNTKQAVLRGLTRRAFFDALQTYITSEPRFTKSTPHTDTVLSEHLNLISIMLRHGIDDITSHQLRLNEVNTKRLRNLHQKIHGTPFIDLQDVYRFFEDFAELIAAGGHIKTSDRNISALVNGLIHYLSTEMVLPYVIQQKVKKHATNELRTSGFVGSQALNHVSMISTLKFTNEPKRSLHLIIPQTKPIKHNNRTENSTSKILEVEAEAPLESTALELSTLPPGKDYESVLVLMCGAGRHARFLADRSREVKGMDISPEFIQEAKNLNADRNNITYDVADAKNYLINPEMENKFDLVALLGLGLGYLKPQEQLKLLKDIQFSLTNHGTAIFDIVDLDKFGDLLRMQGPVGSRFIVQEDRALERLTRRTITEMDGRSDFYQINDTTSYIENNAFETLSEVSTYYVPTPDSIRTNLENAGFSNIKLNKLFDNRYVGMLRYRWIVTAEK